MMWKLEKKWRKIEENDKKMMLGTEGVDVDDVYEKERKYRIMLCRCPNNRFLHEKWRNEAKQQ